MKRIGRRKGGEEGRKERKKREGGGKKRDKTQSLVKVVYTCTINYPPPQLLIFGNGTVAVTNPVNVVLVIGIMRVYLCECAHEIWRRSER